MKSLFIALPFAVALAGQALACGGGFNDFVPCTAGDNPFLAQQAGPAAPPISPVDAPLQTYDLEQQRQEMQKLQQLQLEQQRDAWHDSCPYGSFGCSSTE